MSVRNEREIIVGWCSYRKVWEADLNYVAGWLSRKEYTNKSLDTVYRWISQKYPCIPVTAYGKRRGVLRCDSSIAFDVAQQASHNAAEKHVPYTAFSEQEFEGKYYLIDYRHTAGREYLFDKAYPIAVKLVTQKRGKKGGKAEIRKAVEAALTKHVSRAVRAAKRTKRRG